MARPNKSLSLAETFLIKDAEQMHRDALTENHQSMKNWEWLLRTHLITDERYGLVTQLMFSYPRRLKTSVLLCQAFPILKGARIVEEHTKLHPDTNQNPQELEDLSHVEFYFNTVFSTLHHGHVHLIGIGVLTSKEQRGSCSLQIGVLAGQMRLTDVSPAIPSDKEGLTLSMMNKSNNPDEIFMFMVTMLIPFNGCTYCHSKGDDAQTRTTRTRMLKCGRCWKRLRFSVWYCNAECQRADRHRHRSQDGCGCVN